MTGEILIRNTRTPASRSDLARLELTPAGALRATDSTGAPVTITNLGSGGTAAQPMTTILALNPAENAGVTIDASDYGYVSMYCDGTRWRPKGGIIPLVNRQRGDVDTVTVASGTGQFDFTYTVPAWVLELSTQVRVEVKAAGSADVAQGASVRESALIILIDGVATVSPGAGTNTSAVSECSVTNINNTKNTQRATRNGTGRTGLGQTADLPTPLTINNRTWDIVVRLLNGTASTASNTLRLDWVTILAYVG